MPSRKTTDVQEAVLCKFLLEVVNYDSEIQIYYWEWPLRCRAHHRGLLQQDRCGLRLQNRWMQVWAEVLKRQSASQVMADQDHISQEFYAEFCLRICLRNHSHEWIHGLETNRSAYYPAAMCRTPSEPPGPADLPPPDQLAVPEDDPADEESENRPPSPQDAKRWECTVQQDIHPPGIWFAWFKTLSFPRGRSTKPRSSIVPYARRCVKVSL